MEVLDSKDVLSEGNKGSQENKQKRKLKTPAQVMALEKFYNEHKYPTDELKAKVAEEIGLTEKQISGWFCHRRLKDKRLLRDETHACGRQDRSSGVIQDRGSGLRQDSCGSTKQVEYKNSDPREVESQRLYGHDTSPTDLNHEHRSLYTGKSARMDSTSSESSSSFQDRFVPKRECSYDINTSRYMAPIGSNLPLNPKSTKSTGYKPSGYLKVKGETENVAITAVKRQLGSYYREDGPPLGVEFDSLPPGSFESPSSNPINNPVFIGDSRWPQPPNAPGLSKHPSHGPSSRVHKSTISYQAPYTKNANYNTIHGFGQDKKSNLQLKQKSPLNSYNLPRGPNSTVEAYEDSVLGTSHANRNKSKITSKHGTEGIKTDFVADHHSPYGGNKTSEPIPNYDKFSPLIRKSEHLSKPSNVLLGCSKSLEAPETRPYVGTGTVTEERLHGKRTKAMEYHHPFGVRMQPTNELTVEKEGRVEFPQEQFLTKTSYREMPPQNNQINRYPAEHSSFSEDGSAGTDSSLD